MYIYICIDAIDVVVSICIICLHLFVQTNWSQDPPRFSFGWVQSNGWESHDTLPMMCGVFTNPSSVCCDRRSPRYPPVIKNGNRNPLWKEVLIGKSPVNGPFSIAMFDYWRVCVWMKPKTIFQNRESWSRVGMGQVFFAPEGTTDFDMCFGIWTI